MQLSVGPPSPLPMNHQSLLPLFRAKPEERVGERRPIFSLPVECPSLRLSPRSCLTGREGRHGGSWPVSRSKRNKALLMNHPRSADSHVRRILGSLETRTWLSALLPRRFMVLMRVGKTRSQLPNNSYPNT